MTTDELIDQWEEAWSGKDPGAFAAICTPDIHYEDPLCSEPLEGPAELGRHAARLWAAFPDARLERTGERCPRLRLGVVEAADDLAAPVDDGPVGVHDREDGHRLLDL